MKAITIKQPWATLIALGLKEFETRSWATKHRGPIAIHAGKSIDKEAFNEPTIYSALVKTGIESLIDLPTGAVIAIANLTECHKITSDYYSMYEQESAGTDKGHLIEDDEWWFGNYEEGRYAWQLSDVQAIEPVLAKGQLSLWNWDEGSNRNDL